MDNQDLHPAQVRKQVEDQGSELPVLPIRFQRVSGYTTFEAEYAVTEGDLVFHFYVTEEIQRLENPHRYWLEIFPAALDATAREYFKAEFPRLKAAYTEEQASWWLRAKGFGMLLDPHKLVHSYFDTLDEALDSMLKGST